VPQVSVIRASDIEEAVAEGNRQYLTGNLARAQALAHIEDDELETGISDYDVDTLDQPHTHPRAREYQLVLRGRVVIRELATGVVHDLRAGDFYVIERNTAYAQKVYARTRVLFFKNPAGNDKVPVELDAVAEDWVAEGWPE